MKDKSVRVAFPIVNINGTSGDALMAHYIKTLDAIHALQGIMREGMPHGRDYQTAEPGIYETAREQHSEMLNELSAIESRVTTIALAVQEQLMDRKAMREASKLPQPATTLL